MRLDSFFFGALCVMSGGRLPAALFMVFLLDSKGAKLCKSSRSRQELSNEYFLAKIGFDPAENEPLKVCQKLARSQKKRFKKVRVNIGRSPSAVIVASASERSADKAALRRTLQQACAALSTAGLPRVLLCCAPFNAQAWAQRYVGSNSII